MARFLAAQYTGREQTLSAYVEKQTAPSIREVWTPTAENFFKRVNGPYLENIWAEVLGLAADHPTITTFAKLKKGEKVEKLHLLFNDEAARTAMGITEDQTATIATWLPEVMK